MSTYSVYDNILIKLENKYLRVEMEVDKEINSLFAHHSTLQQQLIDFKGKVEVLTSLKRTFELYDDQPDEIMNLSRSLFKVLCDKQIKLRFLQEKELLLNGYVVMPELNMPNIMQLNREYKLRKQLQEAELLSSFLSEDTRFTSFLPEINRANEMFDLAIQSGANDILQNTLEYFHHFFEKILNIYDIDADLIAEFNEFRTQILFQENSVPMFTPKEVDNIKNLKKTLKTVREERVSLELDIDKLLYQFTMFQNGKKIVLAEIKNTSGELQSILFKEYAIKQKIQELRQYKIDLNNQKDSFMRDPTVDGYTEAVQQLEIVENRFRRLLMHKNFEQQTPASRFFTSNKVKNEETAYNKILFQVLHNNHVYSKDKMVILRLSKPSRLINTHSGKFFFQRTGKTRSFQHLEDSFKKLQTHELH